MNCRDAECILSAYLDGQLSDMERKFLEDHLTQCESCRANLHELTLIKNALRSLPEVEIPKGLHGRIMAAVRTHAVDREKCVLESVGRTANGTFEELDALSENVPSMEVDSDVPQEHLRPSRSRRTPGWLSGLLNRVTSMSSRQWIPLTAAAMVLVMILSVSGTLFVTNGGLALNRMLTADKGTESYAEPGYMSPASPPPEGAPDMSKAASPPFGVAEGQETLVTGTRVNDAVADRKIIRRAQVGVEVSRGKIRETADLAESIVATHFGYVEQSSISGNVDKEFTSYYMVARVPADNVDSTVDELCALGRVTKEDTSAQDITDQYVDLDARLRNKLNQEDRLLEIMGEAQTVGELLQVEGELSRIRGDIESMQAQINNLDKLTSLATVSFSASEEGTGSKPPSPWSDIWRVFVRAWRNLAMFAAQAAPTLIVLGVLFLGGAYLVRRSAKRA